MRFTRGKGEIETILVQYSVRLVVGGALNIALFFIGQRLTLWSSIRRELYLSLLNGSVGAVALVILFPVLLRGDSVQKVLAIVLSALPALSLINSILAGLQHL